MYSENILHCKKMNYIVIGLFLKYTIRKITISSRNIEIEILPSY